MTHERLIYETALQLSDAASLVARSARSIVLDTQARKQLGNAATLCQELAMELPATGAPRSVRVVVIALCEQLGALYNPACLLEWLGKAGDLLLMLAQSESHATNVVWHPAHLAWLEEFLSDCCHALLRGLATRVHTPLSL